MNLKRFEVPRSLGGLCPEEDPARWIASVVDGALHIDLGNPPDTHLVLFLPEGLLATARRTLVREGIPPNATVELGCQGVHWEDVEVGGNPGAFTSLLPPTAARNLGASWVILGHSEERRARLQAMALYDPGISKDHRRKSRALAAVDELLRREVQLALHAGLKILLCVGEEAQERGWGDLEPGSRFSDVLEQQLLRALGGMEDPSGSVVIAYEPVWAIGPGRPTPSPAEIRAAAEFIKSIVKARWATDVPVVYGGGLKAENAGALGGMESIDGGLVGLTRFSEPIGFDVEGLAAIVDIYRRSTQRKLKEQ